MKSHAVFDATFALESKETSVKVQQNQSIKKAPIHIIISTVENCMTKKAKYENTPYC